MYINCIRLFLLMLLISIFLGCADENEDPSSGCPADELLTSFTNQDGLNLFLYQDGKIYSSSNGTCTFLVQYFDPDFESQNYLTSDNGTFIRSDEGQLFPVKNNHFEDFETISNFNDLFLSSFEDTEKYWTNFTVQSPAAPEVADYVALNKCILAETCDFIDNSISLIVDPTDQTNHVLRFENVAPSADMVTSKSSITSALNYFKNGDDLWFQASYFIVSGMPFSLVDFENGFFSEHPGPRIIISNNQIELENKFGAKLKYENNTALEIPTGQWFTLKVHLKFGDENNGVAEVWQDDELLLSETGITIFTPNSIQNNLEVGSSASFLPTSMLVDNIRISNTAF